jgi:hypothetical protein
MNLLLTVLFLLGLGGWLLTLPDPPRKAPQRVLPAVVIVMQDSQGRPVKTIVDGYYR